MPKDQMPNDWTVLIPFSRFAEANGFSRSWLYELVSEGIGPRVIKIGARRFITVADAREWASQLPTTTEVQSDYD